MFIYFNVHYSRPITTHWQTKKLPLSKGTCFFNPAPPSYLGLITNNLYRQKLRKENIFISYGGALPFYNRPGNVLKDRQSHKTQSLVTIIPKAWTQNHYKLSLRLNKKNRTNSCFICTLMQLEGRHWLSFAEFCSRF